MIGVNKYSTDHERVFRAPSSMCVWQCGYSVACGHSRAAKRYNRRRHAGLCSGATLILPIPSVPCYISLESRFDNAVLSAMWRCTFLLNWFISVGDLTSQLSLRYSCGAFFCSSLVWRFIWHLNICTSRTYEVQWTHLWSQRKLNESAFVKQSF